MKIRLGTFNLFQFVEPPYSWYTKKEKFNKRQWFEKTTWIKQQIVKMNCDIIGFQEVFSRDALESLVNELGFKYFETVDVAKLSKNNPYKYMSTTVAIASKYPITNIQKVKVNTPSLKEHHFEGHFHFSRLPIKATVTLPNKTELLVYVCHLKSNRLNAYEHVFNKQHTLEHKKEVTSNELKLKHSASLKQRLCEASSLFYDIRKSNNKPTVLLCDLNDKEFSLTIDASYQYKKENYNPHPEAKEEKRKATSYFLGKGNVLDYIFISNDLREKVTAYAVLDEHLQDNKDGSLFTSDHAQVVCELSFI